MIDLNSEKTECRQIIQSKDDISFQRVFPETDYPILLSNSRITQFKKELEKKVKNIKIVVSLALHIFYIVLYVFFSVEIKKQLLLVILAPAICNIISVILMYFYQKYFKKIYLYIMYILVYANILMLLILCFFYYKTVDYPQDILHLLIYFTTTTPILIFDFHFIFVTVIEVISLAFLIILAIKYKCKRNLVCQIANVLVQTIFSSLLRFQKKNIGDFLFEMIRILSDEKNFFIDIQNSSGFPFLIYSDNDFCCLNLKFKKILCEFEEVFKESYVHSEVLYANNDITLSQAVQYFFQNLKVLKIHDDIYNAFDYSKRNDLELKNLYEIILDINDSNFPVNKNFLILGYCGISKEDRKSLEQYKKVYKVEIRKTKGINGKKIIEIYMNEISDEENLDKYLGIRNKEENNNHQNNNKNNNQKLNDYMKLSHLIHEFKSPLNCISSLVRQYKENSSTAEQLEIIKDIDNFSQYAQILGQDIINFFTSSSLNSYHLKRENFKLSDALTFAYSVLRTLLKYKSNKANSISTLMDVSSDFYIIDGDCFRLKQILINFISNAVKFTNYGSITLKSRLFDNYLQISVVDTGSGIEDNLKEYIFTNNSTQYNYNSKVNNNQFGSGIGLSITKQIANLLEWEVGFNSKIQEGSAFYVNIPINNCKEVNSNEKHLRNPISAKRSSQSYYSATTQKIPFCSMKPISIETIKNEFKSGIDFKININNFPKSNYANDPNNPNTSQEALLSPACTNIIQNNSDNPQFSILVIDDDNLAIEQINYCIKQYLNSKNYGGYKIIVGNDGINLLSEIIKDQSNPKILFTLIDDNMNFINGSEACRIIRKLEKENKIKKNNFICLTSSYSQFAYINNDNYLFDFYLEKPILQKDVESIFEKLGY